MTTSDKSDAPLGVSVGADHRPHEEERLRQALKDLKPREQALLEGALRDHPQLSVSEALEALREGGM